mmetsp:Transcript_40422/g.129816  ORF Transcript_40422/g.129816 Transcript_40422/m.129816 type:complete len:332 (-) Transcript_40422:347-1342(-)
MQTGCPHCLPAWACKLRQMSSPWTSDNAPPTSRERTDFVSSSPMPVERSSKPFCKYLQTLPLEPRLRRTVFDDSGCRSGRVIGGCPRRCETARGTEKERSTDQPEAPPAAPPALPPPPPPPPNEASKRFNCCAMPEARCSAPSRGGPSCIRAPTRCANLSGCQRKSAARICDLTTVGCPAGSMRSGLSTGPVGQGTAADLTEEALANPCSKACHRVSSAARAASLASSPVRSPREEASAEPLSPVLEPAGWSPAAARCRRYSASALAAALRALSSCLEAQDSASFRTRSRARILSSARRWASRRRRSSTSSATSSIQSRPFLSVSSCSKSS